MATAPSSPPPKPVSRVWRPELTRLPRLTLGRRLFRWFLRGLCRFLILVCTKATVQGLENYPRRGPALIVTSHLGDADGVLELACWPVMAESIAKIELFDLPILGWVIEALGVIWVHRGQPDRRALAAALQGLKEGRLVAIAPEGRESLTGGLEPGTEGAAFLALKADVPLVPITVTGTENQRIYGNLKRLRRTPVTLTVGLPFVLPRQADHHAAIREGTRHIMERLARQLPPELRGVYSYVGDEAL